MVFKGTFNQNSSVFLWFVFGRVSLSKTRFFEQYLFEGQLYFQCLRVYRYLKCSNVFLLREWK